MHLADLPTSSGFVPLLFELALVSYGAAALCCWGRRLRRTGLFLLAVALLSSLLVAPEISRAPMLGTYLVLAWLGARYLPEDYPWDVDLAQPRSLLPPLAVTVVLFACTVMGPAEHMQRNAWILLAHCWLAPLLHVVGAWERLRTRLASSLIERGCYRLATHVAPPLSSARQASLLLGGRESDSLEVGHQILEVALDPEERWVVVLNQASALIRLEQPAEAAALLDQLADTMAPSPEFPAVLSNLKAMAWVRQGERLDEVQKICRDGMRAADPPRRRGLKGTLAEALVRMGRPQEALPLLQDLIAEYVQRGSGLERADMALAYRRLAYCLEALGDLRAALAAGQRSIQMGGARTGLPLWVDAALAEPAPEEPAPPHSV